MQENDPSGAATIPEVLDSLRNLNPRLALEWERLYRQIGSSGKRWTLGEKGIYSAWSNSEIDYDTSTIYLDNDLKSEPVGVGVEWLEEAIQTIYKEKEEWRRRAIQNFAGGEVAYTVGFGSPSTRYTAFDTMISVMMFADWYKVDNSTWLDDVSLVLGGIQQSVVGLRTSELYVAENSEYYVGPNAFGDAARWGSTGFKREFRDGSNQVAHTVLAWQVVLHNPIHGGAVLQWREGGMRGSDADIRLNSAIGNFHIGTLWWGRTQTIQDLPDWLGDPSQVGPWTGMDTGDAANW